MDPNAYISILRRTGMVLIAVGVVDIGAMVYCMVNAIAYSSSLNVFAVVAGVFLVRGSLAAAGLVRWFSVFLLAALGALVLAWPVLQPFDLTLTQVRVSPIASSLSALLVAAVIGLSVWVQRQLGRPPVLAATLAAGKTVRSMKFPAAAGLALVALLGIVVPVMLSGESGNKAKAIAQAQLGAGYKYHVSSMSVSSSSRGTSGSARVTAWNEREVRVVPVEWNE